MRLIGAGASPIKHAGGLGGGGAGYKVGDVAQFAVNPGAAWVLANGAGFGADTYPNLAGVLLGDPDQFGMDLSSGGAARVFAANNSQGRYPASCTGRQSPKTTLFSTNSGVLVRLSGGVISYPAGAPSMFCQNWISGTTWLGQSNGGIALYLSTDDGLTWSDITTLLTGRVAGNVLDVLVYPGGGRVYVFVFTPMQTIQVWYSDNLTTFTKAFTYTFQGGLNDPQPTTPPYYYMAGGNACAAWGQYINSQGYSSIGKLVYLNGYTPTNFALAQGNFEASVLPARGRAIAINGTRIIWGVGSGIYSLAFSGGLVGYNPQSVDYNYGFTHMLSKGDTIVGISINYNNNVWVTRQSFAKMEAARAVSGSYALDFTTYKSAPKAADNYDQNTGLLPYGNGLIMIAGEYMYRSDGLYLPKSIAGQIGPYYVKVS